MPETEYIVRSGHRKVKRKKYNVPIFQFYEFKMTPLQCKLGRTALGWGVRELAKEAGVAPSTVTRFEGGRSMQTRIVEKLRKTLEVAGIIFVPEDDTGGQGIRLRKGKA